MQTINESTIFCSKCGQKNNSVSSFCSGCGSQLNKRIESTSNYTQENKFNTYDDMDEINLFVQKNQEFYQEKFNKINTTGDKKTWNWSAFFLSVYWMLYRKMYLQAGGLFLLNMVVAWIPYIGWILSLAIWVGVGLYSNSMYLDHIRKKINEINLLNTNEKEILIRQKGGTNLVLPLVLGIVLVVLAIIMVVASVALVGSMLYYY